MARPDGVRAKGSDDVLRDVSSVPASSVVRLPDREKRSHYHEVKSGETLTGIAKEYGMPIERLFDENGFDGTETLQPGQLIFVPIPPRGE